MSGRVKFEKIRAKDKTVGFRVSFANSIEIKVEGYRLLMVSTDGMPWKRYYNPFAFYKLSQDAFKRICSDWEYKGKKSFGKILQIKQQKWMLAKQSKLNGRFLHEHWMEVLNDMDQKWLAVAKALFHSNFTSGPDAGSEFLRDAATDNPFSCKNYTDYGLKDICKYRAAAMLAHHEAAGFNDGWMDWYTQRKCRAINKTLMNIPPAIPWYILRQIRRLELSRPLLSKVELITTICGSLPQYAQHTSTFMDADKDKIRESFGLLKKAQPATFATLTMRKTREIEGAVTFIADYPDRYNGRLSGLTRRSMGYHEDLRHNRIERQRQHFLTGPRGPSVRQLSDDEEVAKPSIDLPEVEGGTIAFLDTVGLIRNEGIDMHHCLGGNHYARGAVDGKNFFFHVDYAGKKASIQVDDKGYVRQARGPCNELNEATTWGKSVLGKWGQQLRPNDLPNPGHNSIDWEIQRLQQGANPELAIRGVFDNEENVWRPLEQHGIQGV